MARLAVWVWLIAALTTQGAQWRTIAEAQSALETEGRTIASFRIQAVVCAVAPGRNTFVLQDASATALFEWPAANDAIGVGDVIDLSGDHCTVTRGRFGIDLGTAPVVDNGGAHPAQVKSGQVWLRQGRNPIRLAWFNRSLPAVLNVEYEGPDTPREKIPLSALWRQAGGANGNEAQPGLDYSAYTGAGWYTLPNFDALPPVGSGVATNFDVAVRSSGESAGLVFRGFLEAKRAGIYTFYVESADGSRLDVGSPMDYCKVTTTGQQHAPIVATLEQALAATGSGAWIEFEGMVSFLGQSDAGTELAISGRSGAVQATILSGDAAAFTNFLQRPVRALGLCVAPDELARNRTGRMIIPGPDAIRVIQPTNEPVAGNASNSLVLTSARQVQHLKPRQAEDRLTVRLKGVVTQASPSTMVLQDATGGVFVHFTAEDWTSQPRVGDRWKVEGSTGVGDFSPVVFATNAAFLGIGTLPEPIRPTWDQLMNGSLDAQYIEVRGVVTAVSDLEITLLTADGRIRAVVDELRRCYADGRDLFVGTHYGAVKADDALRAEVGDVVRIRACVVALWNNTGQVLEGRIRLVGAVIHVEEPRPENPFALETRKASDLLLFDARANALRRAKVAGQVIHVRPHECYIQDGATGIRTVSNDAISVSAGDLVEAVGFPQLNGAAPVLVETQLRKTGTASLPAPADVTATNLLDRKLDSTLVTVEATLLSDTLNQNRRVLELQAGPHHFLATLDCARAAASPLAEGSRLRLSGVYASANEQGSGGLDSFELLLNRMTDVVVLRKPSWWTLQHALVVVATLAVGLGLALIWITLLRRKVEQRTAQLAKEIEERQAVERHRAIAHERTRVAQDLHDDLGAGLTEVSILGSLAKTATIPEEAKKRYVDQLTDVARSLVTSLDEIVWAVNPQYDSVESLATYYSLFAQRFLNLAGIACRLRVSERIPEHALDSKLRHGIFRAFKESLNNVVRHSGAAEVRLAIDVSAEELQLSVHDNGRGFDVNSAGPGADGLRGMRERMRNLGGSCDIKSEAGGGTTVEFRLPLNHHHHDQSRHS